MKIKFESDDVVAFLFIVALPIITLLYVVI